MADSENQAGGQGGHTTHGPIPTPISISLTNTGTITAFTTVGASLTVPADKATGAITVTYSQNGNPITVPNMPQPSWDSNGHAFFDVDIDQTLINALGSSNTTLTVTVTGTNTRGNSDIPIDIS